MNSIIARVLVVAAALLVSIPAICQQTSVENVERLNNQEDAGLRHYERGSYDKAFESLSATAVRGLKRSQYILAFMFLKGQYVDKSILLGMGWLGVAMESGDPEWIEMYQSLYARATADQQVLIDAKVAQYVEQYGSVTQHVTCSRRPAAGSRRIESRCVKEAERSSPLYPVEMKP